MKIPNPALERVIAQRAALAAKHQGAQPSELVRDQLGEALAREQEIDAERDAARSKPAPKKPVSVRDIKRVPLNVQPELVPDPALAAVHGQSDA
jgi:hypothetical protein